MSSASLVSDCRCLPFPSQAGCRGAGSTQPAAWLTAGAVRGGAGLRLLAGDAPGSDEVSEHGVRGAGLSQEHLSSPIHYSGQCRRADRGRGCIIDEGEECPGSGKAGSGPSCSTEPRAKHFAAPQSRRAAPSPGRAEPQRPHSATAETAQHRIARDGDGDGDGDRDRDRTRTGSARPGRALAAVPTPYSPLRPRAALVMMFFLSLSLSLGGDLWRKMHNMFYLPCGSHKIFTSSSHYSQSESRRALEHGVPPPCQDPTNCSAATGRQCWQCW